MKDTSYTKEDKAAEEKQHAAAADIARGKLSALYGIEPSAAEEIKEVAAIDTAKLSKHQLYMQDLSKSGRGLAEIQTAWHSYYEGLSDDEKHEVWQEFYDEHAKQKSVKIKAVPVEVPATDTKPHVLPPRQAVKPSAEPLPKTTHRRTRKTTSRTRTVSAVKDDLIGKVTERANLKKANHHVKALAFGFGMGSLVLLILLFSFFNERFITPFIRPSQHVSATPIIVDPTANAVVGSEPKIIIPKINIEAPVVYDEPSIEEKAVQTALERGVLHYATTPDPGQLGNSVIFGHSSGNILNKGKYKFAFILLKSLENGDTFMAEKDGKRYVYKVYSKFVTTPTDLSVLNMPSDRKAIMTLITCDPPGMSTNRLIVQAEQIYPDPASNAQGTTLADPTQTPDIIPGNSPSLWTRIKGWFS